MIRVNFQWRAEGRDISMRAGIRKAVRRFCRQTGGSVAVEFAILAPVLLLIISGIIDFGHLYMMDHLITNATREGARYGIAYRVDANNNRIPPSSQTSEIISVVNNYLTGRMPPGSWSVPNPTYDAGTKKLTVTVNAQKTWLGPLSLILTNPFNFSASTTMIAE